MVYLIQNILIDGLEMVLHIFLPRPLTSNLCKNRFISQTWPPIRPKEKTPAEKTQLPWKGKEAMLKKPLRRPGLLSA